MCHLVALFRRFAGRCLRAIVKLFAGTECSRSLSIDFARASARLLSQVLASLSPNSFDSRSLSF